MPEFTGNKLLDEFLYQTPIGIILTIADAFTTPTEEENSEMNPTEEQVLNDLLEDIDLNDLLSTIHDICAVNDRSPKSSYFTVQQTVINGFRVLFVTSGSETRSIVLGEE